MSRRVVYVSFLRLTNRVARDWYLDDLRERGAEVEYWDVVEALREPHDEVDTIDPSYLHRFRTLAEVEERVRREEYADAIFVMLIAYTGRFSNIYEVLSRYDRRMVIIQRADMPTSPAPIWKKLLQRWASPLWLARVALNVAKAKAMRRKGLVKPYDMIFAAGAVTMRGDTYARRIIPINAFDYDEFVRVGALPERLVESRYAVFLDINLPFQSDLDLCGLPAIAADEYFSSLNEYFRAVERVLGMPVVIAAHPKTAYGSERFEGRTVMRGVTSHLVRDSSLVLTHTSTSLSYAVLNRKPLIFIYTDAMRSAYKDNVMRELANFAKYLNAPLANVNDTAARQHLAIPNVDPERYDAYVHDFLTSEESKDYATRDIFCQAVANC